MRQWSIHILCCIDFASGQCYVVWMFMASSPFQHILIGRLVHMCCKIRAIQAMETSISPLQLSTTLFLIEM